MPLKIETMTPEEAAAAMRELGLRCSAEKIRDGIEQGKYPFGVCINMDRREFEIYRALFDRWVKERAMELPMCDKEAGVICHSG